MGDFLELMEWSRRALDTWLARGEPALGRQTINCSGRRRQCRTTSVKQIAQMAQTLGLVRLGLQLSLAVRAPVAAVRRTAM